MLQDPGELGRGLQDVRRRRTGGRERQEGSWGTGGCKPSPMCTRFSPCPCNGQGEFGVQLALPSTPCPWTFPQGKAAPGASEKQQLVQQDHEPLGISLLPPSLMSPGSLRTGYPLAPTDGVGQGDTGLSRRGGRQVGVSSWKLLLLGTALMAKNRVLPSPLAFGLGGKAEGWVRGERPQAHPGAAVLQLSRCSCAKGI